MVWAGIYHHGKTELVTVPGNLNSQRYCDEILKPVALPFMQQHNARPHTARHTQGFLHRNNVQLLPWPARSPDLSPIEHLWGHLGRRVRENHDVDVVRDLERALRVEWARIPLRDIRKLICSMRRWCLAVLACNGGHTRY